MPKVGIVQYHMVKHSDRYIVVAHNVSNIPPIMMRIQALLMLFVHIPPKNCSPTAPAIMTNTNII